MGCTCGGRVHGGDYITCGSGGRSAGHGSIKMDFEDDGKLAVATGLALQTGAIKPCIGHEDVLLDMMDADATAEAHARAGALWKGGDAVMKDTYASREEMHEYIKMATEEAATDCGCCEKHIRS